MTFMAVGEPDYYPPYLTSLALTNPNFSTLPIHNILLTTGEVDAPSAHIQICNQIMTFSNSSVSEYIIFKMKTSENIQV